MESASLKLEDLLGALDPGVPVLTANQRLARHLRLAFDGRCQAQGLAVWESPDILPWASWLQRCWESDPGLGMVGSQPRGLLNPHQEQMLWERAVTATGGHPLLQVSPTARQARQAWNLIHAWRLPLPAEVQALGDDARAFLGWARLYAEWCEADHWLDAARLPDEVAGRIGRATAPRRLLVAGFDELTPQQTSVLEAFEASGCHVTVVGVAPAGECLAVRVALPTPEDEVRAAALWIRECLEKGEGTRLGVVIPDLDAQGETVRRVFDDLLVPDAVLPRAQEAPRPYNISLGRPLLELPVVHTAFLVLALGVDPIPLAHLGGLLRSPYIAGADKEVTRRGLLDARLRRLGEPALALAEVVRGAAAGDHAEKACPVLAGGLRRLLAEREALPGTRPASAWAEVFARILGLLGWPGERGLDSTEFQGVNALRELLGGLSSLDLVAQALDYGAALSRLRRLAADAPFQPRSPEVPVQVLGVLEAAGMPFDRLWVMGLHDEVWPAAARPNPFLPVDLQRRHGLPHASAERELAFARGLTARLMGSAAQVVVSHALQDGERALRPSPLIAALPEGGALESTGPGDYAGSLVGTGRLERLDDDQAPPLPDGMPVVGGTAIFRDQAQCPFRAFASHRLGASEPEVVRVGLDAMARGILVHRALEKVWLALGDYERLCRLSEAELLELVGEAVAEAVAEMAARRRHTFSERFTSLEQWRLERLVREWLALEKGRAPFSVLAPEQDSEVCVGGIPVRTRVDRIDRLPNGHRVIVDYKTGKPRVAAWLGERPEEPQLPLYATTSAEPVDAVLFAQVRPGEVRFMGVAESGDIVPGVKAFADTREADQYGHWGDLESYWRGVLDRLGEDFRAGRAAVDPKDYPETCTYCALGPLCRVGERFGQEQEA